MAEGGEEEQLLLRTPPTQSSTAPVVHGVSRLVHPDSWTPSRSRRSVRERYGARKKLTFTDEHREARGQVQRQEPWTEQEIKALLEFLLFHKSPHAVWFEQHRTAKFWTAAADFIKTRAETPQARSGKY